MPNLTGGAQAPSGAGNSVGNTNQGQGVAKGKRPILRRNRLERARDWTPDHLARVLGRIGIDPEKFNSLSEKRQRIILNRALGAPVSGGGGPNGNGGGGNGGSNGNTPNQNQPSQHPFLDRARAEGTLAYGDVESSLNQRGSAIPTWLQNYRNQITQMQTHQNAQAAPVIAQSQANATAAGQVAPGVDPNSQAGQDAVLAAAARKAMQDMMTSTLQGVTQTNADYLTGRQAVASTAQVGELSQLARDKTDLRKEKGAFVTKRRGELRDEAHTRRLENAAFNLDVAEAGTDLNKYGYSVDEWSSFSASKKNRIRKRATQGSEDSGPDMGSVNKYGFSEKEWRRMSTDERQDVIHEFDDDDDKDPDDGNDFTPLQRRETRADIRRGIAAVNSQIAVPGYKPEGFWQRAYRGLVQEKGYDPILARSVIQIMRLGSAKPALARRIAREYGVEKLPNGKAIKLPPSASSVPVIGDIIGQSGI